ncbi:MAG: ATP-binding cassette domain-containing protein [Spirochaetota bacterium]
MDPSAKQPNKVFFRDDDFLIHIYEFITESIGVNFERSKMRDLVKNPRFKSNVFSFATNLETFMELAKTFSVRVLLVRKELSYAIKNISPGAPLLFKKEGKEFASGWFALKNRRGNKVELVNLDSMETSLVTEDELVRILEIANPDEKVLWIAPEPMYTVKKYNQKAPLTHIERLIQFLKPETRDIWVLILYGLAIGVFSLIVPVAISSLINTVAFGTLLQPIVVLTIVVFVFLIFAGGMRILQSIVIEYVQRRLFVRVTNEIGNRITHLDSEKTKETYIPELVGRFFEVFTLQKNVTVLLVDGIAAILTTSIGFLLISIYHPFFLFYSILLLVLFFFLVAKEINVGGETVLKESKLKFNIFHFIQDMSRGPNLFTSNLGSRLGTEKLDILTQDYLLYRHKHFKVLMKQYGGGLFLQALGHASLLGIGGYLVIVNQLTLGQLVAAELILAKVLDGFSGIGKYLETFYDLLAAVDKTGQLLDLPILENTGEEFSLDYTPEKVEFQGVSYSADSKDILASVNLQLQKGECYTISGDSPDSIAIFLNLLSGFIQPSKGVILFDGKDSRHIQSISLRTMIKLVREIEIFKGTILDNVRGGRMELTYGEIQAALEKVGLTQTVLNLKEGVFTELSSSGYPLLPEQQKLIGIARDVCVPSGILILDDSIDEITPEKSKGLIESLLEEELILIVNTRRVSHFKMINNRIVIEDGKVEIRE